MTRRVLVIDDDADVQALMRIALVERGWTVVCASGGIEGVALLAAAGPFDAIVVDVQMPDWDGWTVLEAVRANRTTADVPVIMATVKAHASDRARAEALGCDAYLTKPFAIAELRAALEGLARPATIGGG